MRSRQERLWAQALADIHEALDSGEFEKRMNPKFSSRTYMGLTREREEDIAWLQKDHQDFWETVKELELAEFGGYSRTSHKCNPRAGTEFRPYIFVPHYPHRWTVGWHTPHDMSRGTIIRRL